MSSFTRAVPANVGELKDYLGQILQNKSHVKSVVVDPSNSHLEISLDWAAHNIAHKPDVYLPLKPGKVNDAKSLVSHMMTEVDSGFSPSDTEVQQLYDMLDPAEK